MDLFLTAILRTHRYGDNGERIPVPLGDENNILTNLRRSLIRTDRLAIIANDPYDTADNDEKLSVTHASFTMSGFDFSEYIMLDARNKDSARDIVANANLVILSGGKCLRQNLFLKEISLAKILKNFNGTVIGVSAGAMNLCETVANFPEELADVTQPKRFDGLGFATEIIIPHFDGETNRYQFPCADFDIVNDYIMPMSYETALTGIPNDSYILIEKNGKKQYFGNIYSIISGKTHKV